MLIGYLLWRVETLSDLTVSQSLPIEEETPAPVSPPEDGSPSSETLSDAASTDHPHTMTELSQLMPEKIDALLQQIGLIFEIEEQPFSVEEFKQNFMRYF